MQSERVEPAGGTAAAAGGAAAAAAPTVTYYSQLQCAGGSGPQAGPDGHDEEDYYSCLMLDVCYDSQAGALLYYTDGSAISVDNGGFKYNFTEPLVLLEPVRRRRLTIKDGAQVGLHGAACHALKWKKLLF